MKLSIILLRIFHGIFALYFIGCLLYLYYSAITTKVNIITEIALISLALEGLLVFVINKGDCILIHLQKRIGDPVPFLT